MLRAGKHIFCVSKSHSRRPKDRSVFIRCRRRRRRRPCPCRPWPTESACLGSQFPAFVINISCMHRSLICWREEWTRTTMLHFTFATRSVARTFPEIALLLLLLPQKRTCRLRSEKALHNLRWPLLRRERRRGVLIDFYTLLLYGFTFIVEQ